VSLRLLALLGRLILLKQRASLRAFVRSLRSPRRIVGFAAMFLLLGFYSWQGTRGGAVRGGLTRDSLAVFAAMMFVMSIAGGLVQQGPRFTPADVDFLFPAPFSPRHLLVWRLLHLWPLTLLSSLFFLAMFGSRLERPGRFVAGLFLMQSTALHLQLLIAVLLTRIGDAAAKRLRGAGRVAALVAFTGAVLYLVLTASEQGGLGAMISDFAQSRAARMLAFPAMQCVEFVFATTPRATLLALAWLLLGAAGSLGLLMLPEVDFREESVATTARVARLLAARRRIGATVDLEERRRVRSGALPAVRLLFRASGAVVWKNLLLLLRSWKSVLPSLLLGLLFVVPLTMASHATELVYAALLPIAVSTLFWSNALGFDLRRDLDRLDQLRALPLSPSAIVLAELLVPWVVGVTLQEALLATIALLGRGPPHGLGLLALALPLLTFLAVVIDNLALFFFAPRAQAGAARGAVASTSPAQMLRFFAWALVVTPGAALGWAVLARTRSLAGSVAAGAALELAFAVGLFLLLVKWFESRDVEATE
jgi:hypothetical protein